MYVFASIVTCCDTWTVAFSPDGLHMLISAPQEDVVTATGTTLSKAGVVHMYVLGVDGWELERRVVSNDPMLGDEFGVGLAWWVICMHACIMNTCADVMCVRSKNAYFAGARNNDGEGTGAGRVHAFYSV